jgi:hypothetical protein
MRGGMVRLVVASPPQFHPGAILLTAQSASIPVSNWISQSSSGEGDDYLSEWIVLIEGTFRL